MGWGADRHSCPGLFSGRAQRLDSSDGAGAHGSGRRWTFSHLVCQTFKSRRPSCRHSYLNGFCECTSSCTSIRDAGAGVVLQLHRDLEHDDSGYSIRFLRLGGSDPHPPEFQAAVEVSVQNYRDRRIYLRDLDNLRLWRRRGTLRTTPAVDRHPFLCVDAQRTAITPNFSACRRSTSRKRRRYTRCGTRRGAEGNLTSNLLSCLFAPSSVVGAQVPACVVLNSRFVREFTALAAMLHPLWS